MSLRITYFRVALDTRLMQYLYTLGKMSNIFNQNPSFWKCYELWLYEEFLFSI